MVNIINLFLIVLCSELPLVLTNSSNGIPNVNREENILPIVDSPFDQYDMMDFLGLGHQKNYRLKRHLPLTNSASKFLLEIYEMVRENDDSDLANIDVSLPSRKKREAILSSKSITFDEDKSDENLIENNFITNEDRKEIEKSNNIITFSSKGKKVIDNTILVLELL